MYWVYIFVVFHYPGLPQD